MHILPGNQPDSVVRILRRHPMLVRKKESGEDLITTSRTLALEISILCKNMLAERIRDEAGKRNVSECFYRNFYV